MIKKTVLALGVWFKLTHLFAHVAKMVKNNEKTSSKADFFKGR